MIRRDTTIDHSFSQSQNGSVVADSGKKEDDNDLFELAADNDHPLSIQPMPPPVPSEIRSPLTDISGANIPLPSETFSDPVDEKDIPESPNTL